MQDLNAYRELARRYGFEAQPESVSRLTQLVARQDCDVDEIARVIAKDPGLRARLLRAANPDAESEADYNVDTVEAALMRNGLGCALLLAMGTPLALVLIKTFRTMLSLKLDSVNPNSIPPLEGVHALGTIGFSGKAAGMVYLRMSPATARLIAGGILGLGEEDLGDDTVVDDAVGELLNIITGNFKSNLCDAGLDCRLEPPDVRRTEDFSTPCVPGGGVERMAFQTKGIVLFVDITVNPWGQD